MVNFLSLDDDILDEDQGLTHENLESRYGDNCIRVQLIRLPPSTKYIHARAFANFKNLRAIPIPDTVIVIGEEAFAELDNLWYVNIGNNVDRIERRAFQQCNSLKNVRIGNSVTRIENGAFSGCSSLPNLVIGNSVKYIGPWAFQDLVQIQHIDIPESVEFIDDYAFQRCTNLRSVSFADTIQICPDSFRFCTNLKSAWIRYTSQERAENAQKWIATLMTRLQPELKQLHAPASAVKQLREDPFTRTRTSNFDWDPRVAQETVAMLRPLPNTEQSVGENTFYLNTNPRIRLWLEWSHKHVDVSLLVMAIALKLSKKQLGPDSLPELPPEMYIYILSFIGNSQSIKGKQPYLQIRDHVAE